MRAVAVLEWTGEVGKPSASRIIPISVFDGEKYQPGGLYLAKPEPLALEPGTDYVLQDAGVARGLFDINTARTCRATGSAMAHGNHGCSGQAGGAATKQGKNTHEVTDAGTGSRVSRAATQRQLYFVGLIPSNASASGDSHPQTRIALPWQARRLIESSSDSRSSLIFNRYLGFQQAASLRPRSSYPAQTFRLIEWGLNCLQQHNRAVARNSSGWG